MNKKSFKLVTQTTVATSKIIKTESSASLAQQDFVLVSENSSSNNSTADSNVEFKIGLSRQNSIGLNNSNTGLNNTTDIKPVRPHSQQITEEETHLNKLRQLLGNFTWTKLQSITATVIFSKFIKIHLKLDEEKKLKKSIFFYISIFFQKKIKIIS